MTILIFACTFVLALVTGYFMEQVILKFDIGISLLAFIAFTVVLAAGYCLLDYVGVMAITGLVLVLLLIILFVGMVAGLVIQSHRNPHGNGDPR